MASASVLLVELDPLIGKELTQQLSALGVEVALASAADAVKGMIARPPALLVVNVELTQGSGFGLINRVLRMEALSGLQIVLVAQKVTDDALDLHRKGPTPAAAYVTSAENASSQACADAILEIAQRILTDPEPGAKVAAIVHIEGARETREKRQQPREQITIRPVTDPLAVVIEELGYRVLRRLRDEDGGRVYACMDDELHRAAAIKLLPSSGDDAPDDERVQRFQRERRVLALLHSPHVIAVYGAGIQRGTHYLVRELIDGESLAGHVAREGPLDVVTALRYARDTALGLRHAAAAGVLHRDVRPENIHVVDGRSKLAGFGMGRRDAPDERRITRAGITLPDATYAAPERFRGLEDARGDIYSLGVTLHTLIAGRPPFTKPIDVITGKVIEKPVPLDVARPGTPANVTALVKQMISENPAERPQTWDAVVALLDEAARVASNESDLPDATEDAELEAVQGNLRLMGVVEIVQSLESARKNASLTLAPSGDEPEGKLAFDDGRLVHASCGALRGNDAFFALVTRTRGSFRVTYERLALEHNIEMAVTGLLLESARRADEAGRKSGTVARGDTGALPMLADVEAAFLDVAGEKKALANDVVDAAAAPPSGLSGRVPTFLGLVAIAVFTGAAVFAGFAAPYLLEADDEDPSGAAVAALIAKSNQRVIESRAALGLAQVKLATLEDKRGRAGPVDDVSRQGAADLQAKLEPALKDDLAAKRLQSRRSDDGTEVVLEIGQGTLFSDGESLSRDGRALLGRIAGVIGPARVSVRVEGHSDDTPPRPPHRNNWGGSGARAMVVSDALAEQGVARSRLQAVALADTKPLVPNRNAKNRARNRRVELHLTAALK